MNAKTFFLSTLYLLFTTSLVQGAAIKQMYEVSLPVVSQQKHVRSAAYEQGLIEVSMRVSGSSLAPTQLDLTQAGRMITQYRYSAMSGQEVSAYMKQSASAVRPRYKLWMKFDEAKLRQLLREKSLPIWGYQRPGVLVWLAVKDGRNRYVLKKADSSQIKDAVEKAAHKRGLPIIWPDYDTQDKKQLSFIDIWGAFWEPIKQVSQRYSVDAILLGKMSWINARWEVNWSLQLEDNNENWQLSALDMGMITSSGIGVATDHISSRFAVFENAAQEGELVLRISDLSGVKDYAAASHYLASLAPVKSLYAKEVEPSRVDFHIELNGDENDLKRIIALGKMLVPDNRTESVLMPEVQPRVVNEPVSTLAGTSRGGVVPASAANSQIHSGGVPLSTPPPATLTTEQKPPSAYVLRYRMNG